MNFPNDIKYNKEHLWIKIDGNTALIGISDFAQDQLGELLFVELPEDGDTFEIGEEFSVVESSKKASSLAAPFKMSITEVNDKLDDDPEYINESPYEGWIVKVQILDEEGMDDLIDNKAYESLVIK